VRRAPLALLALLVVVPTASAVRLPASSATWPTPAAQRHAVAAALRRGEVIGCGGGRADAVALTFDDGPGPYTEALLRELRRAHARATFFLVGDRLAYWPSAPRAESRLGAVGNHTWSHPDLTRLPRWVAWLELFRTQYALRRLGTQPVLFRPPYERTSPALNRMAERLGLLEVLWDVDSHDDVPGVTPAAIVRGVERYLRPGAIVIMHDLHPATVEALPAILHALALRGLRAVSIPELLAIDPPAARQGCPFSPVEGG